MGLAGATVLLVVVLIAAVLGIVTLRRRTRGEAGGGDVAESQLRLLAANWAAVERAAARGGMDAEQLAEVRRRVLGAATRR